MSQILSAILRILLFFIFFFILSFFAFLSGVYGDIYPSKPSSFFFLLGIPFGVAFVFCAFCIVPKAAKIAPVFIALQILFAYLGGYDQEDITTMAVFLIWAVSTAIAMLAFWKRPSPLPLPCAIISGCLITLLFAGYFALRNTSLDWLDRSLYSICQPSAAEMPESFDAEEFNRTAFKIYGTLEKAKPEENMLLPNLSVFQLFGMYFEALSENDRFNFSEKLECFKDEKSSAQNIKFLAQNYGNRLGIKTASTAFIDRKYKPKKEFRDFMKDAFSSNPATLNFENADEASKTIRSWVEKNAEGLGADVEISSESIFLLINASTFFGEWDAPFEISDTKDAEFKTAKGPEVTVPFMYKSFDEYAMYEKDGISAVKLDYLKWTGISMILVLPEKGSGTEEITYEKFAEIYGWLRNAKYESIVNIRIPKFGFKSELPIDKALSRMGIARRDGLANASEDFTEEVLNIMRSVSKIEVDEKGTRIISLTYDMGYLCEPRKFLADRPFKFFVVDNSNGLILFMGTVNDPSPGE